MFKRPLPLVIGVIAVILAGLLFSKCRSGSGPSFQTVAVTRGPITQAVTATGTLNPVVNVQVGSQVSGNIQKLFVDFNSKVKAGDVVAQIDPVLFQAAVTQAEGDVASAGAALELAKINATRTQQLFANKNSAQADVDQALASLHQAEANVKIKQGALDKVKADLNHCTITSPVDGEVISRSVDVGQTVAASLQAPVIFTIANDLTKMQIDASVAEADVGGVAVDQEVDFTVDAFPTQIFHGKVVQVRNAPITVQNVVTYDTVIGVANPDLKLKPGMTANVSIISARRADALKIANSGLRFRMPDEGSAPAAKRDPSASGRQSGSKPPGRDEHRAERNVYVLPANASKPVKVTIRTGISDGIATEVIDGLKENDRVVIAVTERSGGNSAPASNPFGGGPRRP